jgi:hypothetical protein
MKKHTQCLVPLALLAGGLSTLAFTGCSKSDRADTKAQIKDSYKETKAAVVNAWGDVKSFTFEKRDSFSANAKALSSKMESKLSELRASYSEAKASASRKAAMEELKNSESDYNEKLAALGTATADTWDSAKQNVISAWDKLQAAYDKARAE